MKYSFVYILSNQKNGTLYTGITSNLYVRVWQHKNKTFKGFTEKYNVDKLVYYEIFEDIKEAFYRESNLKNWKREWKIKLIEKNNPEWRDLYEDISR
mgnify:FL=1